MTHNTPCANCLTLDPYSSPNQNIKLSWPRSYYHCHWQCRSFNTFRYSWRYVAIIVMFGIHLNRPLRTQIEKLKFLSPMIQTWHRLHLLCNLTFTPSYHRQQNIMFTSLWKQKKKKHIKIWPPYDESKINTKKQSLANQWLPWRYSFDKSLTQEFSCTSGHYVLYHNKVATKITY